MQTATRVMDFVSPLVDGVPPWQELTIKLAPPDDSTRYFNGYVTRFSQGEVHERNFLYIYI